MTKQVNAFAAGNVSVRIGVEDFLNLKIIVPKLDGQNSLLIQKNNFEAAKQQADLDRIKSFQLKATIEKLLKERMNDFEWQLHVLRNGEFYGVALQITF